MTQPDLYALVIKLTAVNGGSVRQTQGRLAHAAFLAILDSVDPTLTQALHDYGGRKPFTIAPLHGFGRSRNGSITIRAGDSGFLRICLHAPLLFQTFISYFLDNFRQSTITLGAVQFVVTEILTTPHSHEWAGVNSVADLWTHWETNDAPHTLALDFTSATAFSIRNPNAKHRLQHVLPDPYFVFGELAGYWDRLADYVSQDAVRVFSAENIAIARHDIKTKMVDFGRNRKQVGFVGQVRYEILNASNQPMLRHIHRLADLAFYTGVGSKTTMGMGQVRRCD
jgi:CRISPR-associated endoribonuclease Cas6